jgi:membrane-associated phospholipid phosphatase
MGAASNGVGISLLVPVLLMPIATVYTQMHYAWDAIVGVLVGIAVPWFAAKIEQQRKGEPQRREGEEDRTPSPLTFTRNPVS